MGVQHLDQASAIRQSDLRKPHEWGESVGSGQGAQSRRMLTVTLNSPYDHLDHRRSVGVVEAGTVGGGGFGGSAFHYFTGTMQ